MAKRKTAAAAASTKTQTAPKKVRDSIDDAGRASPPDRDGDGKAGGSLPGNQTDDHAKGTAAEVLAEQAADHQAALEQIAEDGTATIIIKAATEGNTAAPNVGVNGRLRRLPVGVQVQVNAAELEVLEKSHVDYDVVVPLAAPAESADAAAGVEGSSSAADAPTAEETETTDTQPGEGGEQEAGEQPAEGTTTSTDAAATPGSGEAQA